MVEWFLHIEGVIFFILYSGVQKNFVQKFESIDISTLTRVSKRLKLKKLGDFLDFHINRYITY